MIAALQHREKEPEDWVSGGDPNNRHLSLILEDTVRGMRRTSCRQRTKAEASKRIDALQAKPRQAKHR